MMTALIILYQCQGQRQTRGQTGSSIQDQILRFPDHFIIYISETGRNLSTQLTECKLVTRNGDVNNHIAEHHLQTKHQIDWDSATWITYSTEYYQRLTWFTNIFILLLLRTNATESQSTITMKQHTNDLLTDSNKTDNGRVTDNRQFN